MIRATNPSRSVPPRKQRLAPIVAAVLAALLVVPASYAVMRAYDVLFTKEANSRLVVWSVRIAMFWRLGVGAFFAAILAPLVHGLASRHLARTMRVIYVAMFIVAGMIGVQGIFLP